MKWGSKMNNAILVGVLIFALVIGVGAIIFYYAQDYTYTLDLKEDISTSNIQVTLSKGWSWNGTSNLLNESARNIESISMALGKMKFKNDGVISRLFEVPKLAACFDLTASAANMRVDGSQSTLALWPMYTIYEPSFKNDVQGGIISGAQIDYGSGIATEIYSQNIYGRSYGQQPIEIKAKYELEYYISLKDAFVTALGRNPDIFKNGKISIYELPIKEFNPISPGVTYDSLIYTPTCDVLAREFEPVKTIKVV